MQTLALELLQNMNEIDGRTLYTLLYVATVLLADPSTQFSGITQDELRIAVNNAKRALGYSGYNVPIAVTLDE